MKLTFIGAAHEVTGSCTLLECCGGNFLIDYGMEQGVNVFENVPLPVLPGQIDAVFLTHAHIDHSGMLPKLYKDGFRGKVYATRATENLCRIMLMDSAAIQMSDAEWLSRKAVRAGRATVDPIYTTEDAVGVLRLLGYCIGAKNWERYRSALKFSLIFAFSLSTVLTLICYLFTGQIVSVFLTDSAAYDYGVSFAHILLCTSFLFGIFYVLINALQARGAATESLIVSISRQGLIYIPVMFILGAIFHETGLIWAQPVADVLSLLLALVLYMRNSKRLTGKK